MGNDYKHGDLESRLGVPNRMAKVCQNSIETLVSAVRHIASPYATILRHPETPFYALGHIVKNIYEIPFDFYQYWKYGAESSEVFEKKVSRSLALAELIAFFGAREGAHALSYVSDNNFVQALAGGFIGSEATTAAIFFLTYLTFSYVVNFRSKAEKGASKNFLPALKETAKVSLVTIPVGIISFASADLGIASLAVLLGAESGMAATIGCVAGSVLYAGGAKAAVQNSAENGYLKNA